MYFSLQRRREIRRDLRPDIYELELRVFRIWFRDDVQVRIKIEGESVEQRVSHTKAPYLLNLPPRALCGQTERIAGEEIYVRDGECPTKFPEPHEHRREGDDRHAKDEYSFRLQGGTNLAEKAMGGVEVFKQVAAINGVVGFLNGKFLFRIADAHIESPSHPFFRVLESNGDAGAPGSEVRQMFTERTADIQYRFFVKPEGRNDIAERPGFRNGLKPRVYGFCLRINHVAYNIKVSDSLPSS